MEIINVVDEIEHRLCITLMATIVTNNKKNVPEPDMHYRSQYFIWPPLAGILDVNLNNPLKHLHSSDCSQIKDEQYCYSIVKSWKNNDVQKYCDKGWSDKFVCNNNLTANRYTFMFYEFMLTFNYDTKKFKLKDILTSKESVYELLYDTKKHVAENYPGKEYHDDYLVFANKYIDANALESLLSSPFATKVFENKQRLAILRQKIKEISGEYEKKSKEPNSQDFLDKFTHLFPSLDSYADPKDKQIADLELEIHSLHIMLHDEKLKNTKPVGHRWGP